MTEMVKIIASIDAATSALVDHVAGSRGISAAEYVAESIRRVASSDADYSAFIQAGIDAADRGELVSQEAAEAWFEQRVAARSAP